MRTKALAALAAAAAVAAALAGCGSQIAGLAPVGGDGVTSVRIAAIDVLLENGVEIKVAPVCKTESDAYTCAGETLEGQAIAVSSNTVKPLSMTVSVGDSVIYEGSVQDILDEAAQVNP